jgi:hypothetical protein
MSQKEAQKERERERKHQEDQRRIAAAFNDQGELSAGLIEELLDSDDVRVGDHSDLQEATVGKIQSMLSKQWMLANLTDAQEHDIRFKLEVVKLKILGAHPPENSTITGPTRAFLYDDEMENLKPLSTQERLLIDELIETIKAMCTRGREGFERKQMNTSIARSESEDGEEEESGFKSLW